MIRARSKRVSEQVGRAGAGEVLIATNATKSKSALTKQWQWQWQCNSQSVSVSFNGDARVYIKFPLTELTLHFCNQGNRASVS